MRAALEAMLELRPLQQLSSLQAKVVAALRDPLFCPAVFSPLSFQDALFNFASMKRLPLNTSLSDSPSKLWNLLLKVLQELVPEPGKREELERLLRARLLDVETEWASIGQVLRVLAVLEAVKDPSPIQGSRRRTSSKS